jgi:NADH-quinone oxidoreductase subunit F
MNVQLESILVKARQSWSDFQTNGKPKVRVTIDTSSNARGAQETLEAIRAESARLNLDADIEISGSWGFCWMEPTVSVRTGAGTRTVLYANVTADRVPEFLQRTLVEGGDMPELALGVVEGNPTPEIPLLTDHPFMKGQVRRLMANLGAIDPEDITGYLAHGGYEGLAKALDISDEAIVKEMLDSGVGGRGGANFPVGRKWDFLRAATAQPKYLVCNADEGDPGAWVNRTLLEGDPHLIIEGLMIAARASGAREAYIYIRHEYPLAFERMKVAVKQAEELGLLGTNILGLDWDFDVIAVLGAGSYVCGDETGLINSIDGYRGMPRIKPPFPAQAGLWNRPTNVNNVESYANAPLILRNGAAWWCNINPEGQPEKGTKMFSLSGQIRWPGCFEVPFGSGTVRNMLDQYGGGMREGSVIKGYQPGGPLSGILPASDLDLPAQLGPFRERGMFFGGGGICFFDQKTSILDLALWMTGFCEDESCGRCTTCHGGTQRAVETLRRIAAGGGRDTDLDKLTALVQTLLWSNCQHGQLSPTAWKTAIKFFRPEFESLIRDKVDITRSLPGFIKYVVKSQSDSDLPAALEICPTGAVIEEGGAYRIEDPLCILCGACKEVAPNAIEIRDRIPAFTAAEAAGG